MKKILIHTIAFSPDGVSTAYLYNDIARSFRDRGFEVVVLTTTPHYNAIASELAKQPLTKRCFGLYYTSDFEGIRVIHVPQKKFKSTWMRLLGFLYWHILALLFGLRQRGIEVILSPSPPLTIGLINIIIGKIKRAKVVYNVQEIYPDLLIEQGGLRSRPIIRLLNWLERFVYDRSDAVTTIDQVFYDTIVGRFKQPEKLHLIPNFVDTSLYYPLAAENVKLDPRLFPENGDLKVMYAGNIGHAQDWEPLLQVACRLREEPITFYVVGEGVMKSYLMDKIEEFRLQNIRLLPYQPRESMPHLLAFADLQFIFMSSEVEKHGFPSKVYTIMACKKPLLVCSGEDTPIVHFLKDIGCAKIVSTAEPEQKVSEIVECLKGVSKEQWAAMGEKGYEIILQRYTKEKVSAEYVELVEELLRFPSVTRPLLPRSPKHYPDHSPRYPDQRGGI